MISLADLVTHEVGGGVICLLVHISSGMARITAEAVLEAIRAIARGT